MGSASCRLAAGAVLAILGCSQLVAFASPTSLKAPTPTRHVPRLSSSTQLQAGRVSGGAATPLLTSSKPGNSLTQGSSVLAAISLFGALALASRAKRVAMYGGAQQHRNTWGQLGHMPKMGGAKRKHMMRRRKTYGSPDALHRPIRYLLYDIMEEIDQKIPSCTIVREPEEPKNPIPNVPLVKRYPWAPDFYCHSIKQWLEAYDKGVGLDPWWAPIWGAGGVPYGRHGDMMCRKGPYARITYPQWDKMPEKGTDKQRAPNWVVKNFHMTVNGRNRKVLPLAKWWWSSKHDNHVEQWQKLYNTDGSERDDVEEPEPLDGEEQLEERKLSVIAKDPRHSTKMKFWKFRYQKQPYREDFRSGHMGVKTHYSSKHQNYWFV